MNKLTITNALLGITILCCLSVAWMVHGLPEQIARSQRGVLGTDTVRITETVTADVKYTKGLIYVDAQPVGASFRVRDRYSYDPSFPSEIWEGHFTMVRTGFGAEYYAWSADKAFDGKGQIGFFKGWFVALGQKFCYGEDNEFCLDVILPITEKRWTDEAQDPPASL